MAYFQQRANGKWQAKIRRLGWPEQSKSFQTKEAAEQWARATEREMDIGAFVNRNEAERTSFAVAAKRYAETVLPSKRGQVPDGYRLDRLIERFGNFSLASITPAMLSAFRDERLKAVSEQTVKHELNLLSRVFKACALDWGIALPQGIPTAMVRKPTVTNARDRRLEEGEWELLKEALSECASVYPLAAVEFAIETAARQSEVVSLTWKDVDLKARTARLRGIDGAITKNGDTYRDVPLTNRAVAVLAALPRTLKGKVFQLSQNALKLSWQRAVDRARQTHVHGLLRAALAASGLDGEEIDAEIRALIYHRKEPKAKTVKLLAKVEASDQLLADLHFHDLRHEATSRLAEKLHMHELMKVTGHKSSAMMARYYHPRATDLAAKLG